MQPSDDSRKALTWFPMGRRSVGRSRTTWYRTTEKESNEDLELKSGLEACQVAVHWSEW